MKKFLFVVITTNNSCIHKFYNLGSSFLVIVCNSQLSTLWYSPLIKHVWSFERKFGVLMKNSFQIWLNHWRLKDGSYLYVTFYWNRKLLWYLICIVNEKEIVTYQSIVKFEQCYVDIATSKYWINNRTTLKQSNCFNWPTVDDWCVISRGLPTTSYSMINCKHL